MMNMARMTVAAQGVGVAEAATQQARAFAAERMQGRAPGATRTSPIVDHPDVQRMLLDMRALTAAARAILYACAVAIDRNEGPRAALLTPIAKAFATDVGAEVASLGIQVHGGAGYIEESGAAQYLRDARVFQIYEGTNGIQAIDLVTRKIGAEDGAPIAAVIDEVRAAASEIAALNRPDFGRTSERLAAAADALAEATDCLATALKDGRPEDALAGATPYLRLAALAFGGALLARGALASDGENGDARAALARFFAETHVIAAPGLAEVVIAGSEGLRRAATTNLRTQPE